MESVYSEVVTQEVLRVRRSKRRVHSRRQ